MLKPQNNPIQEDTDIKNIIELVSRNYKFFTISIIVALTLAFMANHFMIPIYKVSSSLLINENDRRPQGVNVNDFLYSNLLIGNQNFQNELWVLKSSPVIEQTIRNLDLSVNYYFKEGFQYKDAYENIPFRIMFLRDHVQPVNVRFNVSILDNKNFQIMAKSKKAVFQKIDNNRGSYQKDDWFFEQHGTFGKLIETPDMAFAIQLDATQKLYYKNEFVYSFVFFDMPTLIDQYKKELVYNVIQKDATVIEIVLRSPSLGKGEDIVNEMMDVYSKQNLNRKNHIAGITIDYIEKQLGEISDSLSQTENNLQSFRSSNQLLDVTEQTTGISVQYRDLQNQMAELVTRKRYYDYVADYLTNEENFSDMIVPSSLGIQDPLLSTLMSELITSQAQRSNLIQNQQERNPLVQKLGIQIDNTRKTIIENIAVVRKTTDISIDEMKKRIRKVEAEISRLPKTQRQLGGIERKYRLNDAIYNYLLEKRAEAKITQASNLPDNIIIEPAKIVGNKPVSPNKARNYLIALFLGLAVPFGSLILKNVISNKIESQENLERLTELPVLGKIMHNHKKNNNVMFEYPKSSIAESYRALRTKLEHHFKGIPRKVIMVTSSIEGEGKSFNALNLAMSYAQLDRRTILVDFDMRKPTGYLAKEEGSLIGLSSYYTDRVNLEEIILKSPHEKLDYISSGPIPPNPVELLALEKTRELLDRLKDSYDCIILDTPPLAQVSDAYLLMDHADIKVVIARYNYTLRKVFALIMNDLKQQNIDNVCVVLNDNHVYRDQYGYGYGYNKKQG
ncbi:MAG: polysaccharide biosynthesis tyrosine autokinase [Bacteroidales bacterium]|nr:polysaccharide biosynthesis tyrosine autokinase [Bacteroidales bacterium]